MKLEVTQHFTAKGSSYYYWEMYDGPDGIDHVTGFANDLIEVFSKVVEWRERISLDYIPDENNCTSLNNETDS